MICSQCNKEFTKTHHRQKLCSKECRKVKINAVASVQQKLRRKNNPEKAKLLDKNIDKNNIYNSYFVFKIIYFLFVLIYIPLLYQLLSSTYLLYQ